MKNIKNLKVRVGAIALLISAMFTLYSCDLP